MEDLDEAALSAQVVRILGRDFQVIREMMNEDRPTLLPDVEPGSQLAKDDQATAGYDPLSAQVTGLLHAATDNLHGVMTMIVDAERVHTYAEYAMIRAGMETAALAWWLLNPGSRKERCTRSLRLFWQDTLDMLEALEQAETQAINLRKKRLAHRNDVARRNAIDINDTDGRVYFRAVVSAFDAAHRGIGALTVWRATSGMIHGRRWAAIALSDHTEARPTADPGMLEVKISGDIVRLGMTYHTACLTLQEAMKLYHQRRSTIRRSALGVPLTDG